MAQNHSAAVPGAADFIIMPGQRAHDKMQINSQGRETIRGATEAIRASQRLDLESPTIGDAPSPHDIQTNSPTLQDPSHDVHADRIKGESCLATATHHITKEGVGKVNGSHGTYQATPSSEPSVPTLPLLHDSASFASTPSPDLNESTSTSSESTAASQTKFENPSSNTKSSQPTSLYGKAGSQTKPHDGKMLFSYRAPGPNAAHRRRQYANTSALTDYEADLTGKDRAKQKEAVRTLLAEKVRDDWKWVWPRPPPSRESESGPEVPLEIEPQSETESSEIEPEDPARLSPVQTAKAQVSNDEESQQESVEEYEDQWKERDEWLSNASDSDDNVTSGGPKMTEKAQSDAKGNPFRFDSPDGVGEEVKKSLTERKGRRKKRLAEELAWNDGLQCFNARRDAWTGARRVTRQTPETFTEALGKPSSHSSQDGSSTAMEPEAEDDVDGDWEADMEVPVAPPLIPAKNAMRASITPTAYNTIYDKVIIQNLSPSCPINLKDITRSCVQGWKRDGEWPPKNSAPEALGGRRRKSLASLFGLEKTKSKEDREKADKDKAEKEVTKMTDDHKPGAFKKFTRKLLLLGKDKDQEHTKEIDDVNNGSNGRNNSVAGAPTT